MFNFNRGLLASTLTSTTSSLVVGISLLTTPSFAHKGEEGAEKGTAVAVQQAPSTHITDLDPSTLSQVIPDLGSYNNLVSVSSSLGEHLSNGPMVCKTIREWVSQNYEGHQSLLPIDSQYPMKSIIANLTELQERGILLLSANAVKEFIEQNHLNKQKSVEPNAQLQIAISLLEDSQYIKKWIGNREDLCVEDLVSLSQPHIRGEESILSTHQIPIRDNANRTLLDILVDFGALDMSHGFQMWFINTIARINYFNALEISLNSTQGRFRHESNFYRYMRKLHDALGSDDKIFKWGDEIFDVSQNGVSSEEKTWRYINSLHFTEFAKAATLLLYRLAYTDSTGQKQDLVASLKTKLGQIKPDQQYGFSKKIKALIPPTKMLYLDRQIFSRSSLYFSDREDELVPEIIDSLVRVGSDFDDDYIHTVHDLSIGMNIYDRVRVMSILSKIPPQDWSTLLNTWSSIWKAGMSVNTIDLLTRIAPEDQPELVNAIQPIMPQQWWGAMGQEFDGILGLLIKANKQSGASFKETIDQVVMSPKFNQDDLRNTANLLYGMQVEYDSDGYIILSSDSEESISIEDDSDESWDLEYESDGSIIISSDTEESIIIEDSSDESSLSSFTISGESESDEGM